MNILIVEDNIHFRTLVRTILEALGAHNIEEARDGAEAIDVLKNFKADIAILDWKMDGVDGVECVKRIRTNNDSPNKFLPIILCSGYSENILIRQALDAGANAFLGKPISPKSLMSRIVSVMKSKQPFIQACDYFGPERRHHDKEFEGKDMRHKDAIKIPINGGG